MFGYCVVALSRIQRAIDSFNGRVLFRDLPADNSSDSLEPKQGQMMISATFRDEPKHAAIASQDLRLMTKLQV